MPITFTTTQAEGTKGPLWPLIDPCSKKQKYFSTVVRELYSGRPQHQQENGQIRPSNCIMSAHQLDTLIYPLAIPMNLRPEAYGTTTHQGSFSRLEVLFPSEVKRFVKAVDVLLPIAVGSGLMTKEYPLLRQVSVQELRVAMAVGSSASTTASTATIVPNTVTQTVSLSRLEIALLNLLSCFGYTRQGYPSLDHAPFLDVNEYNLLKYFMHTKVESYHVYALSMMGYLSVIAEELVGNESCSEPAEAYCSAKALINEHVTYIRQASLGTTDAYAGPRHPMAELKNKRSAPQSTSSDDGSETLAEDDNGENVECTATASSSPYPIPASYENKPLCPIKFADGSMFEDMQSTIVTDYANEYYGGPCTLTSTQEEILLMLKPEMLPGRQLCEVMGGGHEAIIVRNCRLFCSVTGYGSSTRIAEVFPPLIISAPSGLKCADTDASNYATKVSVQTRWDVSVIDAIVNSPSRGNVHDQYYHLNRLRCLHKAFLAFECSVRMQRDEQDKMRIQSPNKLQPLIVIAGGRWGCGVFHGDLGLKILQQWVAASAAGADRLDLFLFGDKLQPQMERLVSSWQGMTVGDVSRVLLGAMPCNSLTAQMGPKGRRASGVPSDAGNAKSASGPTPSRSNGIRSVFFK